MQNIIRKFEENINLKMYFTQPGEIIQKVQSLDLLYEVVVQFKLGQ